LGPETLWIQQKSQMLGESRELEWQHRDTTTFITRPILVGIYLLHSE
jgi:hypothetical protein